MSHSIIIIDGKLGSLAGNATTGDVLDLQISANAAHAYWNTHQNMEDPKAEALHEILEGIQTALVDECVLSAGFNDSVTDWNAEIAYLLSFD